MAKQISDERYFSVQCAELRWWKDYPWVPFRKWHEYDKVFLPHYPDKPVDCAVDVGAGPVPFLINHNVFYNRGISVDPLNPQYAGIHKYRRFITKPFETVRDTSELQDGVADVVFALNMLDHTQDPQCMIGELRRVLKSGGPLFLFVDLDRAPDDMHPITIEEEWLSDALAVAFKTVLWHNSPHWVFSTRCLFFVGEAR